jgi:hypothetical protein
MNLYDTMTIEIPDGEIDGLRVERFEVSTRSSAAEFRDAQRMPPGTYTRLMDGDKLWMSDTHGEKRDHMGPLHQIRSLKASRVLINGLGLGMVLKAALTFDHVEHIDVVEKDHRVIELIGPHYKDPRVTIHHADAYEQAKLWPSGTRWNVGWSDVWGDFSSDDLPSMTILNRAYGRRCDWHRCWMQDLVKNMARQEKREERRYADFLS